MKRVAKLTPLKRVYSSRTSTTFRKKRKPGLVTDQTEKFINTTTNNNSKSSFAQRTQAAVASETIRAITQEKTKSIKTRARRARVSAYASYVAIVALILSVISVGYQAPVKEENGSRGLSRAAIADAKPSVDQVAAAELAAEAAETANLAVATNVANLSISLNAKSELAQVDDSMLSKPQIVQAVGDASGVKEYTTVAGDSVQSIASKYGVSEDSIRWSNNLASDALSAGKTLLIPGVTGVVYTVQGGDTPEKLAEKYRADRDRIVTYNDAELSGLKPGQRIVIPAGVVPETERPGYTAPVSHRAASTPSYYFTNASVSAGNRYSYGYCTWYVYNRRAELGRPVGSFWGDAVTWRSYAQAAGYSVNRTPEAGAVLHDPYSAPPYGHVAVVERVNPDGSILVSEMNYAGWNIISTRTISAGQASSYNYIH